MSPSARKLIADPLTIWSARKWMREQRMDQCEQPAETMAVRSPTTQLPLQTDPQMPKKAPRASCPRGRCSRRLSARRRCRPSPRTRAASRSGASTASTPAVRMLVERVRALRPGARSHRVPAMPSDRPPPELLLAAGTAAIPHAWRRCLPRAASRSPGRPGRESEPKGKHAETDTEHPDRARLRETRRPSATDAVGTVELTGEAPAFERTRPTSFLARARCRR